MQRPRAPRRVLAAALFFASLALLTACGGGGGGGDDPNPGNIVQPGDSVWDEMVLDTDNWE